ncbi:hypothetical protein MRB53_027392 [Persea americana]|uniref:Uncharacterized protein n=1 Tax=Persea americana TaxID=3435 RepID=A0ACC2LM10_PERAE|nr:hypothetical protein MRB53_027392 [Persea americana]
MVQGLEGFEVWRVPEDCEWNVWRREPISQFPRSRSKSKAQASASSAAVQDLFQQSLSQLPPRFTTQDLSKALSLQRDPNACLLLFNWASQQPRFRHDVSTFLIIVKKLGADQLLDEFDAVVSQVLSLCHLGNSIQYHHLLLH